MKVMKKITLGSILFVVALLSISLSLVSPAAAGFTDLSDEEMKGVLFMREEEKLARDVYLCFAELYPEYSIFSNIASSEQNHMDAIKRIIIRYDLIDPVVDDSVGIFTNESLQELYDALITEGSVSLVEALRVGAAIEEIDILDIEEYLKSSDERMINRIYNNLLDGSENHLRAFVKELSMQGVNYLPQYLDDEAFQDIIDDESDPGRNGPIWSELVDWVKGLFRWRFG